jgi:hypothetical protein
MATILVERFRRWWYARKGIVWCPGAIIDGHLKDAWENDKPIDKCMWCGITEEETKRIAARRHARKVRS